MYGTGEEYGAHLGPCWSVLGCQGCNEALVHIISCKVLHVLQLLLQLTSRDEMASLVLHFHFEVLAIPVNVAHRQTHRQM